VRQCLDKPAGGTYNTGMKPYPLKFKPIYKERIWGGRRLAEVFGKDLPPGRKIGESWELADLPADKSVIANGPLAGVTLAEALAEHRRLMTGRQEVSLPFPLLIKLLDARDILSVQVHPDAETCRRTGRGDPKTECWYVIAAEPGAFIYKGLEHGVTRERFAEAIERGTVEGLLAKVPVEPGQCHFLPAGTPHSIGAGLLIAEVQTPSDTTYRVFDFNRLDDTGRPRQLHVAEALEAIHFGVRPESLPVTTVGRLVDCDYFKIDKGHQAAGCELLLSAGQLKTLIFLSGRGAIEDGEGNQVQFVPGDTILVPAAYAGAVRFEAESEYLTVTI